MRIKIDIFTYISRKFLRNVMLIESFYFYVFVVANVYLGCLLLQSLQKIGTVRHLFAFNI